MGVKRLDLAGQTFNGIYVIEFAELRYHTTYWRCKCHCGNIFVTDGTKLKRGLTLSCGCLRPTRKKIEGHSNDIVDEQNLELRLHCPYGHCYGDSCSLVVKRSKRNG